MGQVTASGVTADRRLPLRALRAFLLLGGFLVLWWCLLTGTAQAVEGPGRGPGDAPRGLAGAVSDLADRPGHSAVERDRRGPQMAAKLAQAVRHHAAPVTTLAERTVEKATTEPVVAEATATVRSTVTEVVEGTRSTIETTVERTPLASVVAPEGDDSETLPFDGESSTEQGETPSKQTPKGTATSAAAAMLASGAAATAADPSTTGQDRAELWSPADHEQNDSIPTSSWSPSATATQSGGGASAASDVSGTGPVRTPATTACASWSSAERLPAGPAYPPASSPD